LAALNRYHDNLRNPRPPGTGCHGWLMSTANLGIMVGLEPQQLHDDLRHAIPTGSRRIPDKEIDDAIRKAISDHNGGTFTPRTRPAPVVQDGKAALQRIIDQGKISDEVDLWETSPIRLLDEPQGDPGLLLETLYKPTDLVWIGDRHQPGIIGDTIKTTGELMGYFKNGGKTGPFIIINPLTGTSAPRKTGDGETLRGDGNVAAYRYCMAEFDNLSREDQLRFWSAVKLPIVALIDSGGKSIHAWLQVSKIATVTTLEQWQTEIKHRLYNRLLTPLGIDRSCSNPARLSRLPGHYREEKGAWQRLLWLSAEGRPICQLIT
jgi:hypothetical protein